MNNKIKKAMLTVLCISMIVSTTGCSIKKSEKQIVEITKPVKVKAINEDTYKESITYIGSINPEQTLKLGFKMGGKISKVNVKIGDKIKKGTVLASIDPVDVNFAVEAALAQLNSAVAQVKKAKDSLEYLTDSYNDMQKLYDTGSISESQLTESKLRLDVAKSDYDYAINMQNQARTNYNQKNDLMGDSTLVSNVDGTVVDVLNEPGELVMQGYPVVVVRNENQTFIVGLNQEDVNKVDVGEETQVKIDDITQSGKIIKVSEVPDGSTRTYEVEILLDKNDNPLGAIGSATFITGDIKAFKIPISAILSSDVDYVYLVEDNIAIKKNITIKGIIDGEAMVEGLKDGDKVIIEGMTKLSGQDKVDIIK